MLNGFYMSIAAVAAKNDQNGIDRQWSVKNACSSFPCSERLLTNNNADLSLSLYKLEVIQCKRNLCLGWSTLIHCLRQ